MRPAEDAAPAIRYLRAVMLHRTLPLVLLVSAACVLPQRSGVRDRASEVGSAVASSTEQREPVERDRPFISLEYDAYRINGTGSISGQAFLRTRGGEVKFGAGAMVHLVPVTSYSFEWYNREILGGEVLAERDARAEFFHWTVRADGFGEFVIEELPEGEYFLASKVHWEIQGPSGKFHPAGGWAHARVKVRDGRTTRAVLTR